MASTTSNMQMKPAAPGNNMPYAIFVDYAAYKERPTNPLFCCYMCPSRFSHVYNHGDSSKPGKASPVRSSAAFHFGSAGDDLDCMSMARLAAVKLTVVGQCAVKVSVFQQGLRLLQRRARQIRPPWSAARQRADAGRAGGPRICTVFIAAE